ncbi:hypothetical protein ERO13_D01G111300v2 [Gossypium hirsutum]|uniref:DUF4378 domain-containing protein n=3 Tax=Gossypium TaxID=3633 RepID=A0A5J5SNT8_GOSBA|nr:hypothetical protein ES319_D01G134000v1 [Gossypium barbadense]KAG4162357.1 hypothetical protein ERO13_D01G111300v2 [Gossypium hirsutum]TYG83139.1 hypothetical protein ES288_D01G145200v1 [Gossypium darwinii]TYH87818.1 hypothetical protein ES332_D01G145800v1 [Gossypium tomentosum]
MATRTASSSSPSKPAGRQLGELLQQQQEPFILEIYLSERGSLRNNKSIGCHGNSGSKAKNSADTFSTASNTTVYNSCSDTDIDEPPMLKLYNEREKKDVAHSKLQCGCMEDSPQFYMTRQKSLFLSKLIILSASVWNLLVQSKPGLRELAEPDGSNSSPFSISKRVLQPTNKVPLLRSRRELLELDGMDSTKEWNVYEEQKEIGLAIGDAIAEEITTQVVMDMILIYS